MLSVISVFLAEEADLELSDNQGGERDTTKISSSVNTNTTSSGFSQKESGGNTFTAQDAAKIIERNNQGPEAKAVVNINPSSAAEMSQQSANSASNAANRFSQQSTNAGPRQSSMTSQYVTKPVRVPGRVNTNPTFGSASI